jgi:hypothetical protein
MSHYRREAEEFTFWKTRYAGVKGRQSEFGLKHSGWTEKRPDPGMSATARDIRVVAVKAGIEKSTDV